MKRFFIVSFLFLSLTACSAMQYGWDSPDFEKRLVSIESADGQKRIRQISDFDETVSQKLQSGFSPDYLYEINSNNFYLFDTENSDYYHFKRDSIKTDSNIERIETIPPDIISILPSSTIKTSSLKPLTQADNKQEEAYQHASIIKGFRFKGKAIKVDIPGHEYVEPTSNINLKSHDQLITLEVLSDNTYRIGDTFKVETVTRVDGYTQEPNLKKLEAQVNYENALQRYQELIHTPQPTGYNAGTAFLAGVINQKNRTDAREAVSRAKMRLLREPDYIQVPIYAYDEVRTPITNYVRKVKLKINILSSDGRNEDRVIEKEFNDSSTSTSPSAISMMIKRLKSRIIFIEPSDIRI